MKTILYHIKPDRWRLAGVAVLYVLATLCSLLMPYLMSDIVNNGIRNGDMPYILARSAAMLGLSILALLCGLATVRINAHVAAGFTNRLQKAVFNKVNSLSFEAYASVGTSSLLTRSTDDIFVLQEVASMFVYALVTVPILFFGGAALALSSDWVLSLVLLVLAPAVLGFVAFITRRLGELWENSDKYIDMQNKLVRERLSGIRVIRAFDREAHEHERISDATHEMAHNIIKANVLGNSINPLSIALLNVSTVVMVYIGAVRMQASPLLRAGDVIATIQYVALIMNSLLVLSWTFAFLPRVKVSVRRVGEVLALPGAERSDARCERLSGAVRLSGVTFRYEGADTPALAELDMDVADGEIVAVIGGTGSGKTTLARLLMGFYAPSKGTISLGGRAYESLTRESVRDNIAIALQKSMIFQGTVAENIRMGDKDASMERVEEAARIAQIEEFIRSHEAGYDFQLQQTGSNLSGGQKQRINIARTILKDAAVYLFDDSFSALDYLTESRLRRALNQKLAGRTQIVITQRAATAMRCDRVYVLDRGRLAGCGTHEQLLTACPIYAEICASQLGGAR